MTENNKKSFTSKARQDLFEMYMNSLKQNKIPWRKGWSSISEPYNAISKTKYRGINTWILSAVQEERGLTDPRWATFNQIVDEKGTYHPGQKWHLKKGSKGVHVEYWKVRHVPTNTFIDIREYAMIVKADPEKASEYKWWCRSTTVFSLADVDGAPQLAMKKLKTTPLENIHAFCDEVNDAMGVKVYHSGNQAYYVPSHDTITLPDIAQFETAEGYYSTRLHETAHSTGAKSRLNRDLTGWFGSDSYAREELRAEIAASLLCADLRLDSKEFVVDSHSDDLTSRMTDGKMNHVAYIQSWIEQLDNNPDVLFNAFNDAEKIAAYIEEKGAVNFKAIQDTFEDDYSEEIIKNIRQDFEQGRISSEEYYTLLEKKDCLQTSIKTATNGGHDLTSDVVTTEYVAAREKMLADLGYRMNENEYADAEPFLENGFSLDR